jgi:hypothetical protein
LAVAVEMPKHLPEIACDPRAVDDQLHELV